MQTFLLGQVYT